MRSMAKTRQRKILMSQARRKFRRVSANVQRFQSVASWIEAYSARMPRSATAIGRAVTASTRSFSAPLCRQEVWPSFLYCRTQFNHSDTFPAMMTSRISLQSSIALSTVFESFKCDTPCLTAPRRARTTSCRCSSSLQYSVLLAAYDLRAS